MSERRGELEELCDLCERWGAELRGTRAEQLRALEQLEQQHANVVAMLGECRAHDRRCEALRLMAALARFWWIRGLGPQVQPFVDEVMSAHEGESVDASVVAAAHQGAGELAYARADYDAACHHLVLAADPWSEQAAPRRRADAINWLGMVDREQGRYSDARRRHERALELYAAGSDDWGRAHALSNLGVVAYRQGQLDQARQLHRRALETRQAIDDLHGMASSQGNLALVHRTRGEYTEARGLYRQSLHSREQLGDRWGVAGSRICLCIVETHRGELEAAHEHLRAATRGFIEVGDALGVAESAQAALALFVRARALEDAGRALSVVLAVRRLIDAPVPATERADYDALRRRLEHECGRASVDAHVEWAAGATMTEAMARLQQIIR